MRNIPQQPSAWIGIPLFLGIGAIFYLTWLASKGILWAKYVLAAFAAYLVIGCIHGFIITRRQWSTGVEIARFRTNLEGNDLVCEGAFVVTDLSREKWRWCRIAGQIRVFSEERMNDWKRGFFEHISMPTNDYAFQLTDRSGTVIYAEEGRLRDHFTYLWHKGRGVGYEGFGFSKSKGEGWGKFAFLEFLPPGPGEYRFSFRAVAIDERAAEAYRNLSEIVDLEVFVKEGVMPITQRMYFHKKLDLTAKGALRRGRGA